MGKWSETEIAGHAADRFEPDEPHHLGYSLIYLHGVHQQRLIDHPPFAEQFDRYGLRVLCPQTGESWWTDRVFPAFDREMSAEQHVLQRVLGMIANLGCELAQIGVGKPEDIDLAMKLAQNYPKGPIEIADWLGVEKTHTIMQTLQAITGSDRYRPALWLRRRALLGLSAYEAD